MKPTQVALGSTVTVVSAFTGWPSTNMRHRLPHTIKIQFMSRSPKPSCHDCRSSPVLPQRHAHYGDWAPRTRYRDEKLLRNSFSIVMLVDSSVNQIVEVF